MGVLTLCLGESMSQSNPDPNIKVKRTRKTKKVKVEGEGREDKEKLVPISFKIDRETLEMVNNYSSTRKLSRSYVVRDAIRDLLQEGIKTKPRKLWGNGVMTIIKIEPELLRQLDEFAEKNKLNRSLAIRLAILQYLQKNNYNGDSEVKVEKVKL